MNGLDSSYAALYQSWQHFRKGKQATRPIDRFSYDLEANLLQLAEQINSKTYCHGGYQKVVLREKKRRDLAVAGIRDRVVHRLLYDFLLDSFDDTFDFDVWSCRKGKGLHACLARTQQLLSRFPASYIWRADIVKFFDSVDHQKLLEVITRKHPGDTNLIWLCKEVVASYQTNNANSRRRRGIPIGNLTSQIFANIYLHEFDRFVRHELKPSAYVRYGDDFILFAPTRRQAYQLQELAITFLTDSLELSPNPKNNIVVPAQSGLHFLGHKVHQDVVMVDRYTTRSVLSKANPHNAASYKALYLPPEAHSRLDWIVAEKIFDI